MRKTRDRRIPRRVLVFGTVLGVVLLAPWAAAGETQRAAGRSQFSFPITFLSGASYDSDRSSVDVNDDVGWGFGFGYNLSEKLLLGAEFTWLDASYDLHLARDFDGNGIQDDSIDISGVLDASNFQAFAQYNILPSNVTPFVRGSFGWTWIDSNIPAGQAGGACWWDPWWGYICDTWQPTFSDTAFSYGAAAGVRLELPSRFFAEGSYNLLWIDLDKAGTQSFDGFRLNVGWLF